MMQALVYGDGAYVRAARAPANWSTESIERGKAVRGK